MFYYSMQTHLKKHINKYSKHTNQRHKHLKNYIQDKNRIIRILISKIQILIIIMEDGSIPATQHYI